jgi:hypothetical protein
VANSKPEGKNKVRNSKWQIANQKGRIKLEIASGKKQAKREE